MKVQVADSFWESLEYMTSRRYKIKTFFRSIKNRILKPYTTIKPRYLDHNWTDHVDILPHLMFESLSIFVEKECSPGCVEWYGDHPHMILVGMEWKNVRDELQDLYDWWHKVYIPYWKGETGPRYDGEMPDLDLFFISLNKSHEERTEEERAYHDYLDELNRLEIEMDEEIKRRMHRLVNLRRYMWT